jgi:hypothetical protein
MLEQIILILFNVINGLFDARRIKRNEIIKHWLNALVYVVIIVLLIFVYQMNAWRIVTYAMGAFFGRLVIFNQVQYATRGLKWDYVTTTPKAVADQIQIWIFGMNGKLPVAIYAMLWIISIVVYFLVK